MSYSDRLTEAFATALELHRHQCRKGTDTPYVTHLMAVAATVGECGGDEDQVIAAFLHDAAEDAGGETTLGRIRAIFGDRVADLVEGCSDTFAQPKPPWRPRKEAFIQKVARLPRDCKLIVAADKLHNARTTLRDLRAHGPDTWRRFGGKREGSMWYYLEVIGALGTGWQHPLLAELRAVVGELERAADETETAPCGPGSQET